MGIREGALGHTCPINTEEEQTMVEQDTVRLLRECDAGVKMGISSIDDVLPKVTGENLRGLLAKCKKEHELLEEEIRRRLDRFQDRGKEPNPIAKGMSWMKSTVKLGMDPTDAAVAALMTDGCDMGVKSLSKYLNQYAAADEISKDIAKRLILLEEGLAKDLRGEL